MKQFFISGAVIAAVFLSANVLATELETDEQKLGYIIGMDIGSSLKQQGTDLDLDTLIEAVRATYNNETLAMTPEEAASIRETFIPRSAPRRNSSASPWHRSTLPKGTSSCSRTA